jgi:histidine triad (HIT) family protein
MSDCLFCKFVSGAIPVVKLYEDEQCIAIADIAPKAPVHCLVIPRRHLSSSLDFNPSSEGLAGHLLAVAAHLAREKGIDQRGFRLVLNTHADAGQSVFHVHLHLLGGRPLGEMG